MTDKELLELAAKAAGVAAQCLRHCKRMVNVFDIGLDANMGGTVSVALCV